MSSRAISRILVLTAATALIAPGCSLFKRHPSATNVDTPQSQPLPTAQSPVPTPNLGNDIASGTIRALVATAQTSSTPPVEQKQKLALAAFNRGQDYYTLQRYKDAADTFSGFLQDYPGAPGTEDAHRLLGWSLFRLGHFAEATPYLKRVIENGAQGENAGRTLLMLGFAYHHQGRNDEALATTFQVAPDGDLEARLALAPGSTTPRRAVAMPLVWQVRAHLLRAQIFATQGRNEDAGTSLRKGKRMLTDATGNGIPALAAQELQGEFGVAELEVLKTRCYKTRLPTQTTEETVLAYIEAYYSCIEPSTVLLCDVAKSKQKESLIRAKVLRKDLAYGPLALKDKLPPAGRKFKEPSMATQFETEIRELIQKKVDARADTLRNIEECGLLSIF